MEIDDYLRLAKGLADELTEALPDKMEIAALGVKEKAPFQLLTVRESLLWRTEELAQGACGALAQNQLAVAAILIRAIVESVAVLWRLQQLLLAYPLSDLGKLNDDLMNIFAASRVWKDETRSYQVLNFVDLIDRKIPGSRKHYDDLSEIAHPNWQGVAGMYSKIDKEKYFVLFGSYIRA